MRSSIRGALHQAGLIAAIIAGGLVMGALTPAYSQDGGARPTATAQ